MKNKSTLTVEKSGTLSEHRRNFIKKTGALSVMALFGTHFFTACSSDDTEPALINDNNDGSGPVTITANGLTIDISRVPALQSAGGWAVISQRDVIVINLGNDTFSTVTAVCTHQGCNNRWSFNSDTLRCACHGSEFSSTGALRGGPARSDLRSFQNSFAEGILTITL
ncbi:Rieske (2Fe-2S) iron-sulfur domain-containing protein [Nitritalea halalkaliphila LW7]|uniref:Rieske (2Fe-2S) iron-sulfur domain-containing protein n=1 Tax=Nitritalea halalkaliphila LW7 TaxID=1189621 RepID=I5C3R3_9BACT|nr:Rieske 2Fe-2S domain-containing protein [Nitritalea halalkaliphila]EIM76465.1 Rieske (2Fe-2S) iron-sulfur domain-containing protein [Nitritalea halalkaliphila LW7]